jgi:hypothetical protein
MSAKKGKKRKEGGVDDPLPQIEGGFGVSESKRHSSFIIVLWLESRELPGKPEWRWRVTEVQTGEEAYFHRLADLMTFVSEKVGVPPPS